jgi:hypothetical protein
MSRVWICQCLCPARHCILANVGVADDTEEAEEAVAVPLREAVALGLQSKVLNPWCGLCNARADSWKFEISLTRFRSIEEAMPALKQIENEQRKVAATFGDLPRSD